MLREHLLLTRDDVTKRLTDQSDPPWVVNVLKELLGQINTLLSMMDSVITLEDSPQSAPHLGNVLQQEESSTPQDTPQHHQDIQIERLPT